MRNKPLYLKLFPLLAFLIAISFPLQIYFLYSIPLSEPMKILAMLTPLNLISMTALFIISILTFVLSRQIYKVIPLLLFILFANNAIVGLYGTDYSLLQVGLSFILFGLSLKPFYNREIRAIILNPQLRWWKTPARYNIIQPIHLHAGITDINTMTSNVSTTGIFAEINDVAKLNEFELNQIIDIELLGKNKLNLKAVVVRKSYGEGSTPTGFGLEFVRNQEHSKQYIPWLKKMVL